LAFCQPLPTFLFLTLGLPRGWEPLVVPFRPKTGAGPPLLRRRGGGDPRFLAFGLVGVVGFLGGSLGGWFLKGGDVAFIGFFLFFFFSGLVLGVPLFRYVFCPPPQGGRAVPPKQQKKPKQVFFPGVVISKGLDPRPLFLVWGAGGVFEWPAFFFFLVPFPFFF